MPSELIPAPDSTAVRVALWRALHLIVDPPPHVLEDGIGLRLANPGKGWRRRGDMNARSTRAFRASIVVRARFVEDLLAGELGRGVQQYVILGAGLDTFAQRQPGIASRCQLFEVDQPAPQAWKRQRLIELGFELPRSLHFVPVDFESGSPWWEALVEAGFDSRKPAVVASTGVSMYLTGEAIIATLRQVAALAPGSTFAMEFLLPLELTGSEDRAGHQASSRGARRSGSPFLSFFTPQQMLSMASEARFRDVEYVSAAALNERYFSGRADGLQTSSAEAMLVATT